MKKVMVVRPDWNDLACKWGAEQLSRKTIQFALEHGWNVTDLYADQANKRRILEAFLQIDYASLLGHGNDTTYTANRLERVLAVNDLETVGLCKKAGKIGANFLTCLSGRQLFPYMIQMGFRSIAGYTEEFVFAVDQNAFPNSVAEPFFLAHAWMDHSIFSGATMKEAHDARLNKWQDEITKADPGLKPYLVHDWSCDELFGDPDFRPLGEDPGPGPGPGPSEVYTLEADLEKVSDLSEWVFGKNVKVKGTIKLTKASA